MRVSLGAALVALCIVPSASPQAAGGPQTAARPTPPGLHIIPEQPAAPPATAPTQARGPAPTLAPLGAYPLVPISIEPLAGHSRTRAYGVNNLGNVVGRSFNFDDVSQQASDRTAVFWSAATGALALPTLAGETSAWGLNNAGQASGFAYTSTGLQRAVRWATTPRPMTVLDLGTLVNASTSQPGPSSTAYDLDELGEVTGYSDIPNDADDFTPFHAIRYSDAGGLQDLGTFDTSFPYYQHGYSISYGGNASGQIVGVAQHTGTGAWIFRPFIHDVAGGLRELPIDPAYPANEWYAVAINDGGVIGGHVIAATNQSLPYYWTSETAQPVAVSMPASHPYGEIYGINSQGAMVGVMWNAAQEERGFIFDTTNGVRDLNTLVDPILGWLLQFARDINDAGEVVGAGTVNGLARGFLLAPAALAGGIEGFVRRAMTNQPLEGVQVRAYNAAGVQAGQASTDAAGHYALAVLPGTYYALAINGLGGADQLYSGHPCAACDPTTGDPIAAVAATTVTGVDFSLDAPPAATVGDVSVTEGNAGTKTTTVTVRLSGPSSSPVTVTYGTSDD